MFADLGHFTALSIRVSLWFDLCFMQRYKLAWMGSCKNGFYNLLAWVRGSLDLFQLARSLYWNPNNFHIQLLKHSVRWLEKWCTPSRNMTTWPRLILVCRPLLHTDLYSWAIWILYLPVQVAFAFVIYPCLVVQYMGQAAFLSQHLDQTPRSFFESIPG